MYESKKKYNYGTGRRKSSVARVRVYENGTGSIIINGRDIDDYFGLDTLKLVVRQPLVAQNAEFRPTLKAAGFMTRDPRMKERKKYGLKAARRAPQFSKR